MIFRLFSLLVVNLIYVGLIEAISQEFEITDSACPDQQVLIINNSNGIEYDWDFCSGDFAQSGVVSPNITSLTSLSKTALKFIENNGQWHAFISVFQENKILRLDFGDNIENSPTIVDIGNPSNLLSGPYQMDFVKENDIWYALINSWSNSKIVRLTFGNGLLASPTNSETLIVPGITSPRGMSISVNEEGIFAFVSTSNENRAYVLNFGASILNEPTSKFSFYSKPLLGTDLIYNNGVWHGYIVHEDFIKHLNFGDDISSDPVITTLNLNFEIINGTYFKVIYDGGKYYSIAASRSGDIFVINLGTNLSDDSGTLVTVSNYGVLSDVFLLDVVKSASSHYVFCGDLKGTSLFSIKFSNACSGNIFVSSDEIPEGLSYSTTGTFNVDQIVSFGGDVVNRYSKPILIEYPNIDLTSSSSCFSSASSFTTSAIGLSYSWDFNNDGTPDSFEENPSYQFPAAGTYTVRLDVDDGTCDNFTEQEITIYEEPPIPSFQITGDLCGSSEITFTNQTNDAGYEGPLEYEWDFNGEGTSSSKDAAFTFGSSGVKTITLKSSIPGCENTTQQVINVIPGPTSQFSANSVCEGELMTFTNQSSGADSYQWDLGDGFTSNQADVSHIYTEGGNFTVLLEATDSDGCSSIYEQEVAVSHTPKADFDYDIPCSGGQGIAFFDQSSVNSADILSWEWRIDGELATTEQNPTISFDESGTKVISLSVLSSNGCPATYEESITVLASPQPTFSVDVACQNLVTGFMDTTPEETVVSRLWTINGQVYTTKEVEHVFAEAGTFDVSLEITSDNFCASTLETTVVVPSAPEMAFTVSSFCAGDDILLEDTSVQGPDPVVSRTWLLNGTSFFNGAQAQLSDLTPDEYEITLESTTQAGCVFSTAQTVELLPSPVADFNTSARYGIPPFSVDFSNTSTGASSYSWRVNGNEVSTSSDFNRTFSTEGNQKVELVVTSDDGCTSTKEISILSALPKINLKIAEVTLTPLGTAQKISLMVKNNGNLPIEIFDVIIRAGNDFSISERINQFLDIGEETVVQLTSSLQSINTNNVCISIVSAYDDVEPDDNEQCVSFSPGVILENPYPNPIRNEATIRLILQQESDVEVSVVDASGQVMYSESHAALPSGLSVFRYDFSQFDKGMYFITIRYDDKSVTKRILKL